MTNECEIEFVAEDNVAGQTLLRLVARGSAAVCELLRLSAAVPEVFRARGAESAKYAGVLFDFRYLERAELEERKIDGNEVLSELDDEFRENHLPILERFYQLFDSIFKFVEDLNAYIDEMEEGVFVQHTMDGVLLNTDGCQLMAEAVYLYGVMLLIMDIRLPGEVREKLIVSYVRYKGSSNASNIDEVYKLCRQTGFDPNSQKRPAGYPENYFARIPIHTDVVEKLIGQIRSSDIYNQGAAYPSPLHRSTALCTQAAMLYVMLFFAPDILHNRQAEMREMVDKHFPDRWVISFHMGFLVDLSEAFEPYKAARAAIRNTLQKDNVQRLLDSHTKQVPELARQLRHYLSDGVLTADFAVENMHKLVDFTRSCNRSLRWLMLHRTTRFRQARDHLARSVDLARLLLLTMQVAHFEARLKDVFRELLEKKQESWDTLKKECHKRMTELADYFSGEKALTHARRDENMQDWFGGLADKISRLDYADSLRASRRILHLVAALKDVEEFHQVAESLSVKQFLAETRSGLGRMVRTANVKESVMATLSIVTDFSYAWQTIGEYVPLMRQRIKADPMSVMLLRATFLKLASIVDLPLVRINQCDSQDVVSVAAYYSGELLRRVRDVLEIIPQTMFEHLREIVQLRNSTLNDLPMKLERAHLGQHAQLSARYELAKATHRASVLADGVLGMKQTLLGIVKVDPKQLLEDGIRKELVRQIATAFHEVLQFRTGKVEELEEKLQEIERRLQSFVSAFEYIQDYVNMYGLKIWQEELTRVINFSVEQESNRFLRRKVFAWQSSFQSERAPIPQFQQSKDSPTTGRTFIGRVTAEILSQTEAGRTCYVEARKGWYDSSGRECVGLGTFDLLKRGLEVAGLAGVDRLLCFMVVQDLKDAVKRISSLSSSSLFKSFSRHSDLEPLATLPEGSAKVFQGIKSKTQKMWPEIAALICSIGQKQLIRQQVNYQLSLTANLDSKLLTSSLSALNDSLMNEVRKHCAKPDAQSYIGDRDDNELLSNISPFFDMAGISCPIRKIYLATDPIPELATVMFVLIISTLDKLIFDSKLECCIRRSKYDQLDGAPFVVGVLTLLRQFHPANTTALLARLGQWARCGVRDACGSPKPALALPEEICKMVWFLDEFCRFGEIDRGRITEHVPAFLLDSFGNN
eukprot:80259_1